MKNKAIFLDRDGVINRDAEDYTWRTDDFIILDGVYEACRKFTGAGFLLIVVTNQAGIARGFYGHNDVKLLHEHMIDLFADQGIKIHDVYYCPHHESTSKCLCRKPGSLLVEKALAHYDIDPEQSWFIGDRERDVLAGEGAGVKGIQVPVNNDLRKVLPLLNL